jgi:PAS domain S-box-containing protein
VLHSLGYVVAHCDARGRVLEADDGWTDLMGAIDDDISLVDPRLVPPPDDELPGGDEEEPAQAEIDVGPVVTSLLPFHVEGDIRVVELASFPLRNTSGSFLVAAREALGRAADDLSRRYLAAFVESSDLGIVGARIDGTIQHWNSAATRIFGYSAREAIGRPMAMLAGPDGLDELETVFGLVARGETLRDYETISRQKSGEPVEIHVTITPTRDATGKVVGTISVLRDITEAKATDRLAKVYAGAVETSPTGLVLWRHDAASGTLELVAANRMARRLARLRIEAIGKTSSELSEEFPPFARLTWPPEQPLEHGRVELGTFASIADDGSPVEMALHIFPLSETTVGLTLTEVTNAVLAERERRRLLGRVANAEDAERKRLAEALHDDTIQVLAAANMELGSLRRRTEDGETATRAERIEEKVRHATRALRSLVFELYPPDLNSGGLGPGLRALGARVFDDGTKVVVDDELERRLGVETRITAYRILQEAIGNARRHAGARHIRIRLRLEDDVLLATMTDDGIGFDASEMTRRPGHLGLRTMLERAESHDGSLVVSRGEPTGTVIELRLPDQPELADTQVGDA